MDPDSRFNKERLLRKMEEAKVDAVVANSPWNITYTSGVYFESLPDPITFLVTTRDGKQALIINHADAIYMGHVSKIRDIRSFKFDGTSRTATNLIAVRLLAETLQDYGLANASIGLEKAFTPALYCEALAERLPHAKLNDSTPVFSETRAIKTPAEIEILRGAMYNTVRAIYTAFALARVGDTEKDIATQIQANALRFGAHTFALMQLSAGEQSTVVHALPLPKPIKQGEVIHADFGAVFDGYCSDIARNAIVGRARPEQEAVYAKLLEIQEQTIEFVRPGVVGRDLYALKKDLFAKVGLEHPWATAGHSIGLQVHETFEITRESDRVLEAGMVIMVEPSAIVPGDARYHIEDCILITETGREVLSNYGERGKMFQIL